MSKAQIHINNKYDRVVVLIDMDCFYCQVEEKINPELKGKPIAVVQYNAWRGGGIIAVNYPARDKGVTRHMRGDEAKKACPDIELVRVPNIREKADLSKYREAGKEVAEVLQSFTPLLERASVDEAYLDITDRVQNRLMEMNEGKFQLKPDTLQNTYALGYDTIGEYVQKISAEIGNKVPVDEQSIAHVPLEDQKSYKKSDIKLLIGSSIVNEIRAAVKAKTGYDCSAGIAHNKILAKLVCGMNKPNKQTLLPLYFIDEMYSELPIRKVKGLGGKFGEELCEKMGIIKMADLLNFSKEELQKRYDERNGQWLYLIARGIDLEAVTPRFAPKSIACCKKFPGRNAIIGIATLNHWCKELGKEIIERLEKDEIEYNRKAKQLVVSFMQTINGNDVSSSRSVSILTTNGFDEEKIASEALDVLKKNTDKFFKNENCNVLNNPIKFLGLSVGKFENTDTKRGNTIQGMFRKNFEVQAAAEAGPSTSSVDSSSSSTSRHFVRKVEDTNCGHTETALNDQRTDSSNQLANGEISSKKNSETLKTTNTNSLKNLSDQKDGFKSIFVSHKRPSVDKRTSIGSNSSSVSAELNDFDETTSDSIMTDTEQESRIQSNVPLEAIHERIFAEATAASTEPISITKPTPTTISPTPSTSNNANVSDYTQTYAEFYRPSNLHMAVPTMVCPTCNKNVQITEMQTHTDAHIAYQLSQDQRTEFRSQLKTNIKTAFTSPPAAKRLKNDKKAASVSANNSSLSIDRFLIKKEALLTADVHSQNTNIIVEAGPSTSFHAPSVIVIEIETCSECHKQIPVTQFIEHMDYHVAQKLQIELQREELNAVNAAKRDNRLNNNIQQNKNNIVKNKKKSFAGSTKSVASFFTK